MHSGYCLTKTLAFLTAFLSFSQFALNLCQLFLFSTKELAIQAFFRRAKSGSGEKAKAGYPRFKGVGRYDSITFPQLPSGCNIQDGKLYVSAGRAKGHHIKIVLHRPIEGTPKSAVKLILNLGYP
jgi:hypothetical protein